MKHITFMLGSPPYGGQDVDTVIGIADAALKKGHQVTIVGSGDGTYAFLKGVSDFAITCQKNGYQDFSSLLRYDPESARFLAP